MGPDGCDVLIQDGCDGVGLSSVGAPALETRHDTKRLIGGGWDEFMFHGPPEELLHPTGQLVRVPARGRAAHPRQPTLNSRRPVGFQGPRAELAGKRTTVEVAEPPKHEPKVIQLSSRRAIGLAVVPLSPLPEASDDLGDGDLKRIDGQLPPVG